MGRLGRHRGGGAGALRRGRRGRPADRPDEPLRHRRRGRHERSSSSSSRRFTALAGELAALYPGLLCHTANSAATLRGPRTHFGMIRTGIAMYWLRAPRIYDPFKDDLRPAMKLGLGTSPACAWSRPATRSATGGASSRTRRRVSASCPSATPTASAGGLPPTAATCWSPAGAAASPARSAWTSSPCDCPTIGERRATKSSSSGRRATAWRVAPARRGRETAGPRLRCPRRAAHPV